MLSGGGFLLYTAWAWSDHRLAEKHAREAERHANLASIAKAYIDDIEELLLRADPKDAEKLSVIAWARTLNVLEGLDGNRKGGIIQFLSNVGLLKKPKPTGQQLFIDLGGANLSDAVLSNADLSDATGVDIEELERQAASLEGATMPNGQKYEDWLKSKGRREDGENSGPS